MKDLRGVEFERARRYRLKGLDPISACKVRRHGPLAVPPARRRRGHDGELAVPLQVIDLDHIVLTCADVEVTLAWYTQVLGLAPVRVEEWRRGREADPGPRRCASQSSELSNLV